ncbi:MAG TPA: MBL fold metallo-hydrolase [Chitinispirillaceae bacterium]|nr:MBL fold metallo-hydrolase [Chitinispirillaceae bacterium]
MLIRCWGSRGQIPVSGAEFTRYGGDTTCMEVRSENGDIIVIDAGSGIRSLGTVLLKEKKQKISLLFTHLHIDHIIGLPFFSPLYNSDSVIKIFGCSFDEKSFRDSLNGMMRPPYFPVDLKGIPAKMSYSEVGSRSFRIGSIKVTPALLNHPNGGLGYRFEENGASFVFLTDNELSEDLPGSRPFSFYAKFCQDADLLVHDAEFKPQEYTRHKSWGHSNYCDAIKLGLLANAKRLGLFHINNQRKDKQVDTLVKSARNLVKNQGKTMDCFAVSSRFSIHL